MQWKGAGKQQGSEGLCLGCLSPCWASLLGSHALTGGSKVLPGPNLAPLCISCGMRHGVLPHSWRHSGQSGVPLHHGVNASLLPPHRVSRALSMCILEMGQNAIEAQTGIVQQWLKEMQLLGWTQDLEHCPLLSSHGDPRVPISKATQSSGSPAGLWAMPGLQAGGAVLSAQCCCKLGLSVGKSLCVGCWQSQESDAGPPGPLSLFSVWRICKCFTSSPLAKPLLNAVLLWTAAGGFLHHFPIL